MPPMPDTRQRRRIWAAIATFTDSGASLGLFGPSLSDLRCIARGDDFGLQRTGIPFRTDATFTQRALL